MTFGVLTSALVTIACDDRVTQPEPPPSVTTFAAEATGHPLVRRISILLADSAAVEVTYRTGAEPPLRVVADSSSLAHTLLLTRLRAGTAYDYEVRARNAAGQTGQPRSGSFTTSALPAEFADLAFTSSGTPTNPVTLLQIATSSIGWTGIIAVDGQGRPVWYHRGKTSTMGAWYRADGSIVVIDDGIQIINAIGDTVYALPQNDGTPYGTIHHGLTDAPSGGLLFVATDARVIRDTTVVADAIWEWIPETGALMKRWTAHDFLDWDQERGFPVLPGNWLHTNAVSTGAHGNHIVSMRNIDQVLSISPDWSHIEWRMGGPGGTLAVSADDRFSGQHAPREIAPGRILLFDNAFNPQSGVTQSRALELRIDTVAATATGVWEYRPAIPNTAVRLGSVFRFSNGNTLIDFGWLGPSPIEILEVTSAGNVVWRLVPVAQVISKIYQAIPRTTLFGETAVQQ